MATSLWLKTAVGQLGPERITGARGVAIAYGRRRCSQTCPVAPEIAPISPRPSAHPKHSLLMLLNCHSVEHMFVHSARMLPLVGTGLLFLAMRRRPWGSRLASLLGGLAGRGLGAPEERGPGERQLERRSTQQAARRLVTSRCFPRRPPLTTLDSCELTRRRGGCRLWCRSLVLRHPLAHSPGTRGPGRASGSPWRLTGMLAREVARHRRLCAAHRWRPVVCCCGGVPEDALRTHSHAGVSGRRSGCALSGHCPSFMRANNRVQLHCSPMYAFNVPPASPPQASLPQISVALQRRCVFAPPLLIPPFIRELIGSLIGSMPP